MAAEMVGWWHFARQVYLALFQVPSKEVGPNFKLA